VNPNTPREEVELYKLNMEQTSDEIERMEVFDTAVVMEGIIQMAGESLGIKKEDVLSGPLRQVSGRQIPISVICSKSNVTFPQPEECSNCTAFPQRIWRNQAGMNSHSCTPREGEEMFEGGVFGFPSVDGMHYCEPIMAEGWVREFVRFANAEEQQNRTQHNTIQHE